MSTPGGLLAGAVCALVLASCTRDRIELLPPAAQAHTPPVIREACTLAEERCSRCHDLERIEIAHPALVDWPVYVDRMRRMPGSGITVDEASVIVKCLSWVQSLKLDGELYSYSYSSEH
jgi:hypothetical protein